MCKLVKKIKKITEAEQYNGGVVLVFYVLVTYYIERIKLINWKYF